MKKLLSLMLAMLMLAMPVLSLAEEDTQVIGGADGPTALLLFEDMTTGTKMLEDAIAAGRKVTVDISVPEVTGINTGNDAVDAAIAELLTSMGLDMKFQGDEYDYALTVSDKDLLTLGWTVSGNDAYIKSNLIGGTIVLTAADIEPLAGRLLDMFVMLGAITEQQAASIKESLTDMIGQFMEAFEQRMGMMLTDEDVRALDILRCLRRCCAWRAVCRKPLKLLFPKLAILPSMALSSTSITLNSRRWSAPSWSSFRIIPSWRITSAARAA